MKTMYRWEVLGNLIKTGNLVTYFTEMHPVQSVNAFATDQTSEHK